MHEATVRQIGVNSDTHGLLRPEVIVALAGSDFIIHAGDVGRVEILDELRTIAPVRAIRGNVDPAAFGLPTTDVVTVGEHDIYLLHDLNDLDLDPVAAGFSVVLSGHSHRPKISHHAGVLYFNPGSAGHRRFSLPITLGRLWVQADGTLDPEIVMLID